MRIGKVVIATSDDLSKMFDTALEVLESVGMRVTHETVLERLEAYGAEVSRAESIVRMPSKVIEKAIVAMKRANAIAPPSEGPFPDKFEVSMGDGCFFIYDFERKTRRKATRDDFITTVRFADALPEVTSFAAPVEIGGVPVETMVIEMQALSYIHSAKPSFVEVHIPEQIRYLAELRKVTGDHRENMATIGSAQGVISPLTARETEILKYIAQGYLNKQIAAELGISEQTIKNHVTSILRKLNANARTEAVVVAIKQGLITL